MGYPLAASPLFRRCREGWERAREMYRDRDLAARSALLIAGVAGMSAARAVSFIHSVPDRQEPGFPPLLWLFHQADMLFLPAVNRLPGQTPILYVQCLALALALCCFYLAARAVIPVWLLRHARPLGAASLALGTVLGLLTLQGTLPYGLLAGSTHHYGNDATAATSCAVDDLLSARNPYSAFRMGPCLQRTFPGRDGTVPVQEAAIKTTPLRAGAFRHISTYPSPAQLDAQFSRAQRAHRAYPAEFESYFSYPSAAFLLPAMFVALHIHDVSIFFSLCYLAVAALILRRTGGPARWVALLVILANAALWPTLLGGATDGLYALLVLSGWVLRDRRWASALLLGLAAASRQQAWFYLLFYAVLIWQTHGRREALWRLGIVAGVFAGLNAPFFLTAPGAWTAGVLGPMRDAMFPRGTGLVALSIGGKGSLPLLPRAAYTLLEGAALVAGLWFYRRTCRVHPGTGLVLAPLALFLAYRSLYTYFLPISLLALYPALVDRVRPTDPIRVPVADEQDGPADRAIVAA